MNIMYWHFVLGVALPWLAVFVLGFAFYKAMVYISSNRERRKKPRVYKSVASKDLPEHLKKQAM